MPPRLLLRYFKCFAYMPPFLLLVFSRADYCHARAEMLFDARRRFEPPPAADKCCRFSLRR